MNGSKAQNKNGFTIIEVVLVLAIAALIFLMVFIALPALQRNQRDTARKNQMSAVLAAVTSYQSNNRGKNPTLNDSFAGYLDAPDPGTGDTIELNSGYTLSFDSKPTTATFPSSADSDNMVLIFGAECGSGNVAQPVDGTRKAAVFMKLENGNADYCQEG